MEMPSVVHPVKFSIDGYIFEVRAFRTLTDDEARQVAIYHRVNSKLKKKDKGKILIAIALHGADGAGMR